MRIEYDRKESQCKNRSPASAEIPPSVRDGLLIIPFEVSGEIDNGAT